MLFSLSVKQIWHEWSGSTSLNTNPNWFAFGLCLQIVSCVGSWIVTESDRQRCVHIWALWHQGPWLGCLQPPGHTTKRVGSLQQGESIVTSSGSCQPDFLARCSSLSTSVPPMTPAVGCPSFQRLTPSISEPFITLGPPIGAPRPPTGRYPSASLMDVPEMPTIMPCRLDTLTSTIFWRV